ncbi:hypothetical protein AVDCRST_MAG81-1654 [uncultured Synechococcales cyanobacterium]|uniref:TIGR02588 family protein n=1 Tax=uncultured Synechococcales cyanobacterium TaxID=1936017 RepID=A0A6J4V6S6_9CYAN|nr:hypothetical protein AVDCRST_MAG81-1654 [uncultured Synechococcales cyanobacterium]
MNRNTSLSDRKSSSSDRSPAEQTTFGIALAILATISGLVLYDWLSAKKQPSVLTVRNQPVQAVQGQFYLPFEVTNTGGETAESVQVLAELRINGEVEAGEQQVDFLSGGETESGAFVFSRDPRQGELKLRVASYKLP